MDTNEFLNFLFDKNSKEKVLEALERVQVGLAVRIKKEEIATADDALRIISYYVDSARHEYEEACISYFKAAEKVFEEAKADEKRIELKEIRL